MEITLKCMKSYQVSDGSIGHFKFRFFWLGKNYLLNATFLPLFDDIFNILQCFCTLYLVKLSWTHFFSKLRTDLRIPFWVGSRPITKYYIRGEMYWKWKSTEWMSTWCHQLLSRKRISRGCSCVLCGYSSWLGTRSLCIDVIYVSWRQAPVLFAGIIFKSFTTVIPCV